MVGTIALSYRENETGNIYDAPGVRALLASAKQALSALAPAEATLTAACEVITRDAATIGWEQVG